MGGLLNWFGVAYYIPWWALCEWNAGFDYGLLVAGWLVSGLNWLCNFFLFLYYIEVVTCYCILGWWFVFFVLVLVCMLTCRRFVRASFVDLFGGLGVDFSVCSS